jgi:flavin-dependent dehydrogenase
VTACDVAVVGGGPAASAVALRLAAVGRSVTVVTRFELDGGRTGEVLGPEVHPLLTQLGLFEPLLACGAEPAHGVWSAWGEGPVMAKDFVLSPFGPAFRVERATLDEMLLSAAERAGVRRVTSARRIDAHRRADGWRLRAGDEIIDATFVVDATGRAAAIARAQGATRLVSHQLVALTGRLVAAGATEAVHDDVLFLETTPEGWWYSTVSPGGDLVAVFLTDADLVRDHARTPTRAWSEAMALAPLTASRAEHYELAAFHARPATIGRLDRAAGPGWVAVGDAASTIDPLSGVGVAKALMSGILAANALNEELSGSGGALARYAESIRSEYESSLRMGAGYYGSERRWPDASFWRRRHDLTNREVIHGAR